MGRDPETRLRRSNRTGSAGNSEAPRDDVDQEIELAQPSFIPLGQEEAAGAVRLLDGHGLTGDGYLAPLPVEAPALMADLWRFTEHGARLRPLEKYERLLRIAGAPALERGAQPYQDAALVIRVRNAIAHYLPEDRSADIPHRLEQGLRGKFDENPLMAGLRKRLVAGSCSRSQLLGLGTPGGEGSHGPRERQSWHQAELSAAGELGMVRPGARLQVSESVNAR